MLRPRGRHPRRSPGKTDNGKHPCEADAASIQKGSPRMTNLPQLTPAEQAAARSMPADFVRHLLAGERAELSIEGRFLRWVPNAPGEPVEFPDEVPVP